MNSGVSAFRVATRSWPASGPERPVRDPCPDPGGFGAWRGRGVAGRRSGPARTAADPVGSM